MKKLNFPMLADILFYAVCVFAVALCVLRFYRVPISLSLFCAVAAGLATGGLSALFLYGRDKKRNLSKKEREEREAVLLHLTLEKAERVRALLLESYARDGKDAHCEGEELSVDGVVYVPIFTMQPLSADEVARLLRCFGTRPFTLVCNALTPEAEKLLLSFGRRAETGNEVYALLRRTDTVPDPLICGDLPKATVKQKLARSFSKANARPFFVGGLLLLVMSLFTIFPVYYLIAGSALLVCAITTRLFGVSA